jgi:hypothetical protein
MLLVRFGEIDLNRSCNRVRQFSVSSALNLAHGGFTDCLQTQRCQSRDSQLTLRNMLSALDFSDLLQAEF